MRILILLILLTPLSAAAQAVSECDWRASARNLVEPWEANTRTFANGDVRLALIDTLEPAAAAFHVLILSPPDDELGSPQCRMVSWDGGGSGFGGITFEALEVQYDPSVGLTFDVPVTIYNSASGVFEDGWLSFSLNQATGEIFAAIALP